MSRLSSGRAPLPEEVTGITQENLDPRGESVRAKLLGVELLCAELELLYREVKFPCKEPGLDNWIWSGDRVRILRIFFELELFATGATSNVFTILSSKSVRPRISYGWAVYRINRKVPPLKRQFLTQIHPDNQHTIC